MALSPFAEMFPASRTSSSLSSCLCTLLSHDLLRDASLMRFLADRSAPCVWPGSHDDSFDVKAPSPSPAASVFDSIGWVVDVHMRIYHFWHYICKVTWKPLLVLVDDPHAYHASLPLIAYVTLAHA